MKRLILILLCFSIKTLSSYSQPAEIDSLEYELSLIKDAERRLVKLVETIPSIRNYNPEGALRLGLNGLELCDSVSSPTYCRKLKLHNANSLSAIGETAKAEEGLIELESEALAAHDTACLARVYSALARVFEMKGEYDAGLVYGKNAYQQYTSINDSAGLLIAINNLGNIQLKLGHTDSALTLYSSSLEIASRLSDVNMEGNSLSNIGMILFRVKDYIGAYEKTVESFAKYEFTKNKAALATSYMNAAYYAQYIDHKKDSVLPFLLKATRLNEEVGYKPGMAACYNGLGVHYNTLKKPIKALKYHRLALRLARESANKIDEARILVSIGHDHKNLSNRDSAFIYLETGLQLAKSIKNPHLVLQLLQNKSEIHYHYAEYESVIQTMERQQVLSDSLADVEKAKGVQELIVKYEAQKKDAEIALLNTENERQSAVAKAERNKRLFTLGVSISLLIIVVGGGLLIQRNRKHKHQVEISRAELEKNLVQNDFLRSQLDPHFVKNALGNIHRLLANGKTKEAQAYTERFQKLMNLTLQNSRSRLIGLDQELEMMEHYMALEADRLENSLQWSINVKEGVDVEDIDLPPMILQPLVENALKHGVDSKGGKGVVSLEVRIENDRVMCVVQDNGSGIDFERFKNSTSHGLRITRERLEMFSKLHLADARLETNNLADGAEVIISFTA